MRMIIGGDKDVIGPPQFVQVCKDFNLIKLVSKAVTQTDVLSLL
jgi:hypothetical protein